jgi:hypothetical protein
MTRVVVPTVRQGPDDVEGPEGQRAQGNLGAARDRRVDLAVADRIERLAERHAAGRAGVRRREDRPADIERDPEIGGRGAAEDCQGEVRRDGLDPALQVLLVLALRVGDSAEGAAEEDPDAVLAGRAGLAGPQPRVLERELPGDEPELAEPIELPRRLRRHPGEGVEVVDLGGDLAAERRRVEAVDPLDRRAARPQTGPERVATGADRRDRTDARNPDPSPRRRHGDGFAVEAGADSSVDATASAMSRNVASVRPAIGRVKSRSTRKAQPGTRGRKRCSISTWLAPCPSSSGRSSIRQVTSIPFVAPPRWTNRSRRSAVSAQVNDRQATGSPRPSMGMSDRRATNATSLRPASSGSAADART